MPQIHKRTNPFGKVVYRAQVRVKRDGIIIANESSTFPRKAMAQAWGDKSEAELNAPGGIKKIAAAGITVGDVLHRIIWTSSARCRRPTTDQQCVVHRGSRDCRICRVDSQTVVPPRVAGRCSSWE